MTLSYFLTNYLGIFHLELATLTARHRNNLSADNPMRVRVVNRRGKPYLRFRISDEVAFIELPTGISTQEQTVKAVVEQLRQSFTHVVLEVDGNPDTWEGGENGA